MYRTDTTDDVKTIRITRCEAIVAFMQAMQKLVRIIDREGDADGRRYDPRYLQSLYEEFINVDYGFGIKKESAQLV